MRQKSTRRPTKKPQQPRVNVTIWVNCPEFWSRVRLTSSTFCMYLVLQYLDVYFSRYVFKYGIQCIFQKLSSLASKKCKFNYPKMGLIKLLLPFCPPCLDYLQERPKYGLDRYFIHKSVGKCDIQMQNWILMTSPYLSFTCPEQNKNKKATLRMLLHHFHR